MQSDKIEITTNRIATNVKVQLPDGGHIEIIIYETSNLVTVNSNKAMILHYQLITPKTFTFKTKQ